MKKIALAGAALALAVSGGNALAAGGPNAGSFGLNISVTKPTTPMGTSSDFMIAGKYMMAKDMAVLAGIGISITDNGQAANNKSNNIGFMGGIRKYTKTDDFAPFIGGRIQYMSARDSANNLDVTDFSLMAEFGAEYFLGRQFSVEGSVGAGYASHEYKTPGAAASTKATALGSVTSSVSVNYYF